MKHHRLAFIDTETTGFDLDSHELIEIGVVLVDQDWTNSVPTFTLVEEFDIKIKPKHIASADPVSLKVNKYNELDWQDAMDIKDALKLLNRKVKDCIMVAHNLCFDASFIDKAYKQNEVKNEMHYLRIDTITMAYAKLHNRTDIDKYSLRTLCEYFKIDNKNAHSALSDAKALYELFKHLINI